MNEARPYASLSSGLLARKGAAKPAKRPQSYGGFEDLGWNDMGYGSGEPLQAEPLEHVPSSISALTPPPKDGPPDYAEFGEEADEAEAFAPETSAEAVPEQGPIEAEAPSVIAQQRAIQERFDSAEEEAEAPAAAAPAKRAGKADVVSLPKRKSAPKGRKAAFTLRLDGDRHLRLRLACAVTGRSAQQIVTTALDEALAAIPEIEALAARAAGAKRN